MDIDTAAAIDRLSDSIVRLEQSSRGDVTQLGDVPELRGETRQLRVAVTELRRDMTELRGDMTGLRDDMGRLRVELREELAEDRRHTSALFESVRAEIRVLGSAIATFSTKLDSLQR